MTHDLAIQELSDEQLAMVAGGHHYASHHCHSHSHHHSHGHSYGKPTTTIVNVVNNYYIIGSNNQISTVTVGTSSHSSNNSSPIDLLLGQCIWKSKTDKNSSSFFRQKRLSNCYFCLSIAAIAFVYFRHIHRLRQVTRCQRILLSPLSFVVKHYKRIFKTRKRAYFHALLRLPFSCFAGCY